MAPTGAASRPGSWSRWSRSSGGRRLRHRGLHLKTDANGEVRVNGSHPTRKPRGRINNDEQLKEAFAKITSRRADQQGADQQRPTCPCARAGRYLLNSEQSGSTGCSWSHGEGDMRWAWPGCSRRIAARTKDGGASGQYAPAPRRGPPIWGRVATDPTPGPRAFFDPGPPCHSRRLLLLSPGPGVAGPAVGAGPPCRPAPPWS
jgi:hypothetical protein